MNEVIVQDERFPEWMKAWNAKTAEVDQQLLDYFQENTQQTAEAWDNVVQRIAAWWEKQHMDPVMRAELASANADEAHFREQNEKRVQQLVADGRLDAERRVNQGVDHY